MQNQSINQLWTYIINIRLNYDLIDLLDSYRPICFHGGGAKVTQHNGVIQHSITMTILKLETSHFDKGTSVLTKRHGEARRGEAW